jgi:hypothetical protein
MPVVVSIVARAWVVVVVVAVNMMMPWIQIMAAARVVVQIFVPRWSNGVAISMAVVVVSNRFFLPLRHLRHRIEFIVKRNLTAVMTTAIEVLSKRKSALQ